MRAEERVQQLKRDLDEADVLIGRHVRLQQDLERKVCVQRERINELEGLLGYTEERGSPLDIGIPAPAAPLPEKDDA